jgi:hypothetical protein
VIDGTIEMTELLLFSSMAMDVLVFAFGGERRTIEDRCSGPLKPETVYPHQLRVVQPAAATVGVRRRVRWQWYVALVVLDDLHARAAGVIWSGGTWM